MSSFAIDRLTDYPFDQLRTLLDGITPPAGRTPLVLSVGEPRHAPPAFVAEEIARHAHEWGRYPPLDGTPAFRAAVADWLTRRYGLPAGFIDPDHSVLPVAGTREALFLMAFAALPERTGASPPLVLLPNPFYQVYLGAAVIAGAEPRLLSCPVATGLPDLAAISRPDLDRSALFYLCSPANPQGAVADDAYLDRAIALARDNGVILCVDECYAEIYDAAPPPGALSACARCGSLENVVVFHSLSKRSSAPGLRSGFVAGDPRLIARFRRLRAYGGATLPLPILAASTALWRDEGHVAASRAAYRAKFDLAEGLLAGRFGFFRPPGGFFLWLDVGDGEQAARRLWAEQALRTLPGAYLSRPDGHENNPGVPFLRIALIDGLAETEDALRRLTVTL